MADEITNLTSTEQTEFSAEFFDDNDNPAEIDGVPVWSTSQPDVATVEPSEDGRSCVVKAAGGGDARVTMIADGARGSAQRDVIAVADIHVFGPEATVARLKAGPVTQQA